MRKIIMTMVLAGCVTLVFGEGAGAGAGAGHSGGHRPNPNQYYPNGFPIYPTVDVTNGIPAWVNNYSNGTTAKGEQKGSYVRTYDNTTQNGKIYTQTISGSGTSVTIVTVPQNDIAGANNQQGQQQQPQQSQQPPQQQTTETTTTFSTDK